MSLFLLYARAFTQSEPEPSCWAMCVQIPLMELNDLQSQDIQVKHRLIEGYLPFAKHLAIMLCTLALVQRWRVIQAKLRSMTHLLGSGRKPEGKSLSHSPASRSSQSCSPRSLASSSISETLRGMVCVPRRIQHTPLAW